MSLDEITARIREKKNRMGYCYEYLGAQVLKSGDTVRRMALHQDGTLYTMLDMLDELKLELRLNDEIIQSHQDILEFLKRHKIEADKVDKTNLWTIHNSLTPDIDLYKVRASISGKGPAPRVRLYTRNQFNYQLLGLNWIYREMNMR